MSTISFIKTELATALARGVRQCVVIGHGQDGLTAQAFEVFAVDERPPADAAAIFVPTDFKSETLATALEKSDFDGTKASLFVWLGSAGYRTVEAALATLTFIATLPAGSGVVFDYATERIAREWPAHTALDALASRIWMAGGNVKHLIQPPAVMAMLRGLGFKKIVDLEQPEAPLGGHLVSAVV